MKDRALLVVSFGTSHADTREKTIGAIEKDLAAAFPEYEIRRAFTSGMIMKVLKNRDNIHIDDVNEALERLAADGFTHVLIQPTHVIPGDEYDDLVADAMQFQERFETFCIGKPLLFETEDQRKVVRAVMEQMQSLKDTDALVLMGHGTEHHVNPVYAALDYLLKDMGYRNVFVGTVEAYPDLDAVMRQVSQFSPERVVLLPLMVVAGDHAVNDMAGEEEDSWKSIFEEAGYEVECVLKGLGEFQAIRNIYLEHAFEMLEQGQENASAEA